LVVIRQLLVKLTQFVHWEKYYLIEKQKYKMLLAITKKIYPTSGAPRQLFDKLGRSINADHNAATMFQIVEFAIEAVAIHAILNSLVQLFQSSGGTASGWVGWGLAAFVWFLSIAAATTIQIQYASNLYMMEQVKHDKNLADKLGAGAKTYTRNAWILFFFCLVLNAWGGYILLDKVIFKADQSQIAQVDKAFAEAKKGANERYDAALGEAKKYDEQIAQSRTIWSKHAAAKPDEKTYAANKMKKETADLLAKKTAIIEAATADRKSELEQEKAAYNKQKAALVGAVQSDLDKQVVQEWLSLAGSLFFSFTLLILVGALHRRATKNELLCGVKYVLQMPSNEEQSALNSFSFLGKFVVNGIGQTFAVAGFFVAQKLLRTRLNLSGYNDTAATQNVLKQTKIELAQAQLEAEQQAREAAKSRVENVQFEVEQDEIEQHYPEQNKVEQTRVEEVERKQNTAAHSENSAKTTANNSSANSAGANSIGANSAAANSQNENSTTANSAGENSQASRKQTYADIWREQQRIAAQAHTKPTETVADSPTEPIDLETKIKQHRGAQAAINKTQSMAEYEGKMHTLRALDTMANTYKTRAHDMKKSPESRIRNAQTYAKIIEVINSNFSTTTTKNEQQN
jgi:hypothetical protein